MSMSIPGPTTAGVQILHIAIGTSISSFFCIILLICGFYHRRKFRSERTPPDHDHVEVRYVSAPTGCNTTDRLLMEEKTQESPRCQKVSMVWWRLVLVYIGFKLYVKHRQQAIMYNWAPPLPCMSWWRMFGVYLCSTIAVYLESPLCTLTVYLNSILKS